MADRMTRRAGATFLAVQASVTVGWWPARAMSTRVRGWFELDASNGDVLDAFFLGDVVVLAGGSLVACIALARAWPRASMVVVAVAGGAAYATLYLATWIVIGGHGW